jgi:acyl dehydratase
MPATDLIGKKLPRATIVVERGPVARFAEAVLAESPVYSSTTAAAEAGFPAVPVPPTFTFIAGYWGSLAELQPAAEPDAQDTANLGELLADLRKDGGLLLHGEQEFRYHKPVFVGMTLHSSGVVENISVKEGKGGATMTAVNVRTDLVDDDGEPVVTQIMTFLLRKTPKA